MERENKKGMRRNDPAKKKDDQKSPSLAMRPEKEKNMRELENGDAEAREKKEH